LKTIEGEDGAVPRYELDRKIWTDCPQSATIAGVLDLNWVRVFAKVAELRSVTAAARSLRMPKSSVSRNLAELEAMLGVRLLQRTTRRIGLTGAGLTFYPYCVRILSDAGEAEER
jgi:DNA-binding transcriptional LysR family regulator